MRSGLLLFLFLYSVIGYNQNNISGTIYKAGTKEVLPNANILLQKHQIVTVSDQSGKFSLNGISEGPDTIKVSYIGCQSYLKAIEIKKMQPVYIEIYLRDSVFTGRELHVTANKENDILDQPMRMNIISAKIIEALPVQNTNEMIDYVPGVSMSNTFGIFSSKAIVSLRGLPTNDQSRTLVLLDGVPLNKSDEGSVNWNMINKNNIESIHVIKGPGPAKYGSGAMGGVINIISKKPDEQFEGNLSLNYGTYNTLSGNISISGINKPDTNSIKKFYWLLSGFGRTSDGYITELDQYVTVEDSILVPTFLKEINTTAKTGYVFNKKHSTDIQLSFYDDMRGNGVKVFDDFGAYSTHRTYSGIAKYNGKAADFQWDYDMFLIRENYIRTYEYMSEGLYSLYIADAVREDVGADISVNYNRFALHQITTGINYKLGSVDGKDTYYTSTDIISNRGKMQTASLFLQDEMYFMERRLQVNAGLRYDIAHYFDGLFSIQYPSYALFFYENFENNTPEAKQWDALCPRVSGQYKFSRNKRVYVSAAKGFRAPILDDMSRTGKKKGGFKIANPDLDPEHIITYETGGDFELFINLTVSGSVYYSTGRDFMYYVSTGDSVNMGYKISPIFEKRNIGKVKIYGAEIECKYEPLQNLSLFVNYSYTHAQIKEHGILDPNVDVDLSGKFLTDIPNHKVSGGISWENKIINTSLLYKYIGTTWINEQNIVDEEYLFTDKFSAYSLFNLRLERKIIKKLSASLSIENIFDKIYLNSDVQKCLGRFITFSAKYTF